MNILPVYALKAYRGSRSITPPILILAIRGEWLTSRPGRFTAAKVPRYSLNRRSGGPQSRSRPFGEEKIKCCCCRDSNPDRPVCGVVTIPTTISCLSHGNPLCLCKLLTLQILLLLSPRLRKRLDDRGSILFMCRYFFFINARRSTLVPTQQPIQ